MVARAEDVEVRPRRVRLDEDKLALAGLDHAALADLEQRAGRGLDGAAHGSAVAGNEALLAEPLLGQPDGEGDGGVVLDGVAEGREERRVERVDRDRDRAPAREPDVEAVVVGQPVAADPAGRAVQHLGRLADHRRFDAAAGDRAGHLA